MAKSPTKTTSKGKEVATRGSSNVPDHLRNMKPQGRGTSTDAHDNIVPMGRILQKGSPEVEKKGARYIANAEPGDIYIKNLEVPIIKGEDGFLFQPCHYDWGYVEWLPRGKGGGGGGGYVAFHHKSQKPKVRKAKDPMNPARELEVRVDNGNVIVETRYHSGFIIDEEGEKAPIGLTLPFAGSGHTVSKNWMGMMNRKSVDGVKADSWWAYYRLKSIYKEKNENSWYMFEVTDAGPEKDGAPTTMWAPTAEDIERGEALFTAMDSGAKQFDASQAAEDEGKM